MGHGKSSSGIRTLLSRDEAYKSINGRGKYTVWDNKDLSINETSLGGRIHHDDD